MNEVLVVTCKVSVNGSPLEPEWAGVLGRVVVDQYLEKADRFGLYFGERGLELFDAELFKPGTKIQIDVEPNESGNPMIKGEVTAVAPELVAGKPSTLQVDGFDGWYRWGREQKRRTFLDMTAGEIVRQVASDRGVKAEVDAGDKFDYLLQDNVTDLAFLMSLANRHRYDLTIDTDKITFKKPAEKNPPVAKFTWGENLLHFVPRETAARQPSEVIVRGWDPKAKKPVIGKAGTGEEETEVGSGKKAGDLVSGAFGKAGSLAVERPVSTEAEAAATAKRLLSELTMGFLEIEATTKGVPDVRPGCTIEVRGVGEKYEGEYYVTRAQHRLSPRGYATKIWGRRNTLNENKPPKVESEREETKEEKADIEVMVIDALDEPLPNAEYAITLSDGTQRKGKTDSNGNLKETGVPKGSYRIEVAEYEVTIRGRA